MFRAVKSRRAVSWALTLTSCPPAIVSPLRLSGESQSTIRTHPSLVSPCEPLVHGHMAQHISMGHWCVQGLYCLGSDAQAALHTPRHVHIPLSQWDLAVMWLLMQGGAGQWWSDALRRTSHLLCHIHLCPWHGQRPQEGPFSGPSLPAEEQGNGIPATASRSRPDVRHSGQRGRSCRRRALTAGCSGERGQLRLPHRGVRPQPPTPRSCSSPAQPRSQYTPELYGRSGR